MIELSLLIWVTAAIFAYIGWLRGWTKEIISLAGITLGLFALNEFDTLIRQTLFGELPVEQVFAIQATIFLVIVFFAYQTNALAARAEQREQRDELQTRALGGLVGFANGYLVAGTLWYFLDIANYPLSPYVVQPEVGSTSATTVSNLPLYLLTGNTRALDAAGNILIETGPNDLLSLMVVVLFVVVLVII